MHHYKKFFIAAQELFAAMQQYIRKPHFLIQNSGLAIQIIALEGADLAQN